MKNISVIYFTPALLWGIFILYFSLIPGQNIPHLLIEMNDKVIHAGIYFVAASLIYLGFIRFRFNNPKPRGTIVKIIAGCLIFGACIELLQHYLVVNRNGDWFDFLANAIGSVIGALLIATYHRLRA